MNERFENLAEEAMVHVPGSKGLHTRAFSLEKFAELIVRECAGKAYAGIGPDSLDAYDRGWQNGRNSASQVIKEHFGVEE